MRSASSAIFRRAASASLVHFSRNKFEPEPGEPAHDENFHVDNDLIAQPVEIDWFGDRAERSATFARTNKKGDATPCDVPDKVMRRVQAIITKPDFPILSGIVEAPTLRADGSILDKPGYDAKSKLYYDPGLAVFPAIPERPTKAHAAAALAMLRDVIADFPFADEDGQDGLSESVMLALLLTAVIRRSLPLAPMFGISANEAQSGKTLAAQVASILMTGRKTAERPGWGRTEEERRKALGSALVACDPVLLYDNVEIETPLEGASFAAAITGILFADRILGKNDGTQISALTNALMSATGNHLTAKGDMAEGRVLLTRIITDSLLADRMDKYRHRPLESYVMKHRPALVVAALTVLRGYIVAKDKIAPSKFRLQEWGDMIAAPLEWLGLPNPALAETRTQDADPTRELHCDIIRAWSAKFGTGSVTTATLISNPAIAEAVANLKGISPWKIETTAAASALRSMEGLARMGYRVQRIKGDGVHAGHWSLKNIGDSNPWD